ncbi:MAG: SGNH/GDSL hydrolase family protein [Defluviitaleaceae bacterium]|nr:SGNH/GDSL hydrolase family protein [Defluviitaleaceae bacterium]MCL2835513.1 SGNH/GDSL hydrolase family protein [Defluviitaleaceae bacterium]
MKYIFNKQRVLFQGDSVTDCGRDRCDCGSLGNGYVKRAADIYNSLCPDSGTVFLNRGVSGNRVRDVLARYAADILELKPDALSILIGINDVWRRYDSGDPTAEDTFTGGYRELLSFIKRDLPETKIIMMDPFLLHVLPGQNAWREDLEPKIQAVRELAGEFADIYIPLDGLLARFAVQGVPARDIAEDGVHPTDYGHALIAREWLRHVGVI